MAISELATLLLKEQIISKSDYLSIKKMCGHQPNAFVKSILALGIVEDDGLAKFIADRTHYERIDNTKLINLVDFDSIAKLDTFIFTQLEVLPLAIKDNYLYVVMPDPLDKSVYRQIEFFTNKKLKAFIAPLNIIQTTLKQLFPNYQPKQTDFEMFLNNYSESATQRRYLTDLQNQKVQELIQDEDIKTALLSSISSNGKIEEEEEEELDLNISLEEISKEQEAMVNISELPPLTGDESTQEDTITNVNNITTNQQNNDKSDIPSLDLTSKSNNDSDLNIQNKSDLSAPTVSLEYNSNTQKDSHIDIQYNHNNINNNIDTKTNNTSDHTETLTNPNPDIKNQLTKENELTQQVSQTQETSYDTTNETIVTPPPETSEIKKSKESDNNQSNMLSQEPHINTTNTQQLTTNNSENQQDSTQSINPQITNNTKDIDHNNTNHQENNVINEITDIKNNQNTNVTTAPSATIPINNSITNQNSLENTQSPITPTTTQPLPKDKQPTDTKSPHTLTTNSDNTDIPISQNSENIINTNIESDIESDPLLNESTLSDKTFNIKNENQISENLIDTINTDEYYSKDDKDSSLFTQNVASDNQTDNTTLLENIIDEHQQNNINIESEQQFNTYEDQQISLTKELPELNESNVYKALNKIKQDEYTSKKYIHDNSTFANTTFSTAKLNQALLYVKFKNNKSDLLTELASQLSVYCNSGIIIQKKEHNTLTPLLSWSASKAKEFKYLYLENQVKLNENEIHPLVNKLTSELTQLNITLNSLETQDNFIQCASIIKEKFICILSLNSTIFNNTTSLKNINEFLKYCLTNKLLE